MTDSNQISTASRVLALRAISACRKAGWEVTAAELQRDLQQALGNLRELLIVRDCAEHALACLEANGFDA